MKKFILDLICDAEGHPSCTTTVLAITGFAFFIFVTMFLLIQGKTWTHYEIFAGTILTACFGAQVTGKFINSRGASSAIGKLDGKS